MTRRVGLFSVLAALILSLVALNPSPAAASNPTCNSGWASAIVFVRPNGASGLGHIGVGIRQTCDPNDQFNDRYLFGSIENPTGAAYIAPGQYNGGWYSTAALRDMFRIMKQNYGYTTMRTLASFTGFPRPNAATPVMRQAPDRGYNVAGNNCANFVYEVLTAFGVRNLPLLQVAPDPNTWVAALPRTGPFRWNTTVNL